MEVMKYFCILTMVNIILLKMVEGRLEALYVLGGMNCRSNNSSPMNSQEPSEDPLKLQPSLIWKHNRTANRPSPTVSGW